MAEPRNNFTKNAIIKSVSGLARANSFAVENKVYDKIDSYGLAGENGGGREFLQRPVTRAD